MSKLYSKYATLYYKVMYRHNEYEQWKTAHFDNEEKAIDFYKIVFATHYECRLLKIEALESWGTK